MDLPPQDEETNGLPPPYTGRAPSTSPSIQQQQQQPPPTTTQIIQLRRSLTDTREQISSNIRILKLCPHSHPEIITTRMSRSQFTTHPSLTALLRPELDGLPTGFAPTDQDLLHVAMIVSRKSNQTGAAIEVVLRSRATATVEDAMESLLERVEILVLQVLMRHGKVAGDGALPGCCHGCAKMVLRAQQGSFAPL